jgi:hypothetical protein
MLCVIQPPSVIRVFDSRNLKTSKINTRTNFASVFVHDECGPTIIIQCQAFRSSSSVNGESGCDDAHACSSSNVTMHSYQ